MKFTRRTRTVTLWDLDPHRLRAAFYLKGANGGGTITVDVFGGEDTSEADLRRYIEGVAEQAYAHAPETHLHSTIVRVKGTSFIGACVTLGKLGRVVRDGRLPWRRRLRRWYRRWRLRLGRRTPVSLRLPTVAPGDVCVIPLNYWTPPHRGKSNASTAVEWMVEGGGLICLGDPPRQPLLLEPTYAKHRLRWNWLLRNGRVDEFHPWP